MTCPQAGGPEHSREPSPPAKNDPGQNARGPSPDGDWQTFLKSAPRTHPAQDRCAIPIVGGYSVTGYLAGESATQRAGEVFDTALAKCRAAADSVRRLYELGGAARYEDVSYVQITLAPTGQTFSGRVSPLFVGVRSVHTRGNQANDPLFFLSTSTWPKSTLRFAATPEWALVRQWSLGCVMRWTTFLWNAQHDNPWDLLSVAALSALAGGGEPAPPDPDHRQFGCPLPWDIRSVDSKQPIRQLRLCHFSDGSPGLKVTGSTSRGGGTVGYIPMGLSVEMVNATLFALRAFPTLGQAEKLLLQTRLHKNESTPLPASGGRGRTR